MKNIILIALVIAGNSTASIAYANSLSGRTLSCTYDSSLGFGSVTTDYSFFSGPKGVAKVARSSSVSGYSVMGYELAGSKVVIEDPDETSLVYDISTNNIKRTFKDCVMPGEGGGDSHPVCEVVTEHCTLN